MNALINATQTQTVTMSSLELVEFINSQRKDDEAILRHDSFMAKVPKVLSEKDAQKFLDIYSDAYGRQQRCYVFPKREACLMAMSYSYELQAVVYDRMTALEAQATTFDITNPVHLLQAIEVQARLNIQLAAERDHAIATKAQIGSKREATAMANTATANRKLKAIESQLDQARDYASVKKVEALTKRKYEWKPLKHWSVEHGIEIKKAFDANYEKGVNTYSSSAWLAVYGVDIYALECAK